MKKGKKNMHDARASPAPQGTHNALLLSKRNIYSTNGFVWFAGTMPSPRIDLQSSQSPSSFSTSSSSSFSIASSPAPCGRN